MFLIFGVVMYLLNTESIEINTINRIYEGATLESQRIHAFFSSISIFLNNALFGIGQKDVFMIQVTNFNSVDHNMFSRTLASNGLIGTGVVVYLLYSLLGKKGVSINAYMYATLLILYIYMVSSGGDGVILIFALLNYIIYKKKLKNVHDTTN